MDHDGEIASEVATTAAATEKKLEKPKSYKIPKKGVVASLVVAKQVKSKKVSKEIKHEKGDNLDLEQDSHDQVDSFSDGEETVKVAKEPKKTQDEGATPASVESCDDEAMPEVPPLTAKQKSDREKLDLDKKMSKIFGTSSDDEEISFKNKVDLQQLHESDSDKASNASGPRLKSKKVNIFYMTFWLEFLVIVMLIIIENVVFFFLNCVLFLFKFLLSDGK